MKPITNNLYWYLGASVLHICLISRPLPFLYSNTLSKLMPWKILFSPSVICHLVSKLCVLCSCSYSPFWWVSFRNYSLKGWPESWRLNARSWPASWSDASLARTQAAWAASGTGPGLPAFSLLRVAIGSSCVCFLLNLARELGHSVRCGKEIGSDLN